MILLSIICRGALLFAEENSADSTKGNVHFGIFSALNLNLHNAQFQEIPGVESCCPEYSNGSGFGPQAGLLFQFPLSQTIVLHTRAGLFSQNATLRTEELKTITNQDGEPITGTIEHSIESSLLNFDLGLLAGIELAPSLTILAGGSLGIPLQQDYSQREVLLAPSGALFENGTTRRNESSGAIPGAAAVMVAARMGISYEVPLNAANDLRLVPELFASYSLNSIVETIDWHPHIVAAGLSFRYVPQPEAKESPPPIIIQVKPPALPPPAISAALEASGIDDNDVDRPRVLFKVEEHISSHFQPLLAFVFFDNNSDKLAERYIKLEQSPTENFKVDDLNTGSILGTYRHILNIIGQRLRQQQGAAITVTGSTAGTDNEIGGIDLARRRAETVKRYLTTTWKIEPGRIETAWRLTPERASSDDTPEGIAENRRIEIKANGSDILKPVTIYDTVRTIDPAHLRVTPTVQAEAGLAAWEVTAYQSNRLLNKWSGTNEIPPVLEWEIPADKIESSEPLVLTLNIRDNTGQTADSDSINIPVRFIKLQHKKRAIRDDVRFERYTVLFQVRSAEIDILNAEVLEDIRRYIVEGANVRVIGYSDLTGEEEFNLQLSRERAEKVATLLGMPDIQTKGMGEKVQLYDNQTPEGRFYSRTVEIFIEFPLQSDNPE